MKRILITGQSSYVGNELEKWLNQSNDYIIDKVSVKDEDWRKIDFSNYDALVHLAGIVHSDNEIEEEEYYKVNSNLTYELAVKAKYEGLNHFLFLSTMNVFGKTEGIITSEDIPNPITNYGKSKYLAEKYLDELANLNFKVAIVRPPMIYGGGSPGNYQRLSRFAKKTIIFPQVKNKRSMIFIDHLCEYLKILIDTKQKGFFHPQNHFYVNTTKMVFEIANVNNQKMYLIPITNPLIKSLERIDTIKKLFGDLYHQMDDPIELNQYNLYNFEETIWRTESIFKDRPN